MMIKSILKAFPLT